MSGYSYSYKVYKKYLIDIYEYFEDTDFTRAFIYRKNSVGKYLVEIVDFPMHTEKSKILDAARIFITDLENIISPIKLKKKKALKKQTTEVSEELNDKPVK